MGPYAPGDVITAQVSSASALTITSISKSKFIRVSGGTITDITFSVSLTVSGAGTTNAEVKWTPSSGYAAGDTVSGTVTMVLSDSSSNGPFPLHPPVVLTNLGQMQIHGGCVDADIQQIYGDAGSAPILFGFVQQYDNDQQILNVDVQRVLGDATHEGSIAGNTFVGIGARAADGSGNAIAPAATALSTAQWTNALATALGTLNLAAIATQVEQQIMDETDSRQVLAAIVNKINATDTNLAGLTTSAIAPAVRDQLLAGAAPNSMAAALTSLLALLNGVTLADGAITAAKIGAGALNGKGDWIVAGGDVSNAATYLLTLLEAGVGSGVKRFTGASLVNAPSGGGGGGGDPTEIADAVAARLIGQEVKVSAPVDPDGSILTLIRGDDHLVGDRLPTWVIDNYSGPDLTAATASLRLKESGAFASSRSSSTADFQFAATLSIDGSTVTATAPISAAQSGELQPTPGGVNDSYQYQLIVATSGGQLVTLAYGPVAVMREITPEPS